MKWLTVKGSGSWSTASSSLYRGGPHQVDDDVAAEAEAAGYAWLLVTDEPVPGDDLGQTGVLTLSDLGLEPSGADEADDAGPQVEQPPVFEQEPNDDGEYDCPECDRVYRSAAALGRHVQTKHPESGADDAETPPVEDVTGSSAAEDEDADDGS